MEQLQRPVRTHRRSSALRTFLITLLSGSAGLLPSSHLQAQVLRDRVSASVSLAERMELPRSGSVHAASAGLAGPLSPDTQLTSMRLALQPSAAQQADLKQLLAAQNNPSSPSYHQWMTPAQFGARFGVSDGDLAKLKQWLSSQGFNVESVTPGRNAILFSGSSGQVESAFRTSMQRYNLNGEQFFENSTNLQIPSAFGQVVAGVANLSSFRPKSRLVRSAVPVDAPASVRAARPDLTTTNPNTGALNYYLTPYDFRQIYNMTGLLGSGFNGSGITIAVAGQSAVDATQIGYFQSLTGQPQKAPTLTLVPNTGTSLLRAGDEGESEIDIEYAGGTAPGATINFVYTGSSTNASVFDSVLYAIDNKLAPIISLSYGSCEGAITGNNLSTLEYALQQANAQGQTVVASSGDTDAATCDVSESASGQFQTAIDGATVSYPASSAYVTGVGGTTLNDVSSPSSYWSSTNNTQNGSALGYIPEVAWNDTALLQQALGPTKAYVLGSGGGASKAFGKPSWQSAAGVPADGRRDVPDVSFAASPNIHGYTFCSADLNGATVAADACTASQFKSIVGGTSLSAPNFAAMLAIVEQANGNKNGLGNINPLLYKTASGTAGSSVFHDITSGNNFVACATGYPDCTNGQLGYAATIGYDLVTGLGSLDGAQFAAAIKAAPAPANAAGVVISIAPETPTTNTAFTASAVVTSNNTTVPTGMVVFTIDGTASPAVTLITSSGTLAISPTASLTVTRGLPVGSHTITAAYSGDGNYAAATSTNTVVVVPPTVGSFTLTSAPATLTVASGGSAPETLTLTSAGGFADIVNFANGVSLSGTNASTFPGCYSLVKVPVPAGGTATATFTIYTTQALCTARGSRVNAFQVAKPAAKVAVQHNGTPLQPWKMFSVAGALLACFRMRRFRPKVTLAVFTVTAGLLTLGGCGSGSAPLPNAPTTPPTTTAGTYTVTVLGTSVSNSSITASTTFQFTVQ